MNYIFEPKMPTYEALKKPRVVHYSIKNKLD